MRTILILSALLAATALGGCSEEDLLVPDFNNPGLDELEQNPSRAAVVNASTGLLIGSRVSVATRNGYVALLGILGREAYNFDAADPRFIIEMLESELRGSGAFGGNLWTQRYRTLRTASLVLQAVDRISSNEMPDAEKEAVRGFTKTMMALEYLMVINTRDANGAVLDVDRSPAEEPGDIVSRDQVFARIVQLLDEASSHLQAAGGSFPFPLSSGYAGFDTPAGFLRFNRALKARVDVYTGNYQQALQSLAASFVSTAAPLDLGVYHAFSDQSGDVPNLLFDPNGDDLRAHPSIVEDAERKPDGSLDDRVLRKIIDLGEPVQVRGLSSQFAFGIYGSPRAPVPIIRNEELILLRAEANLGLGAVAAAAADINFIRVNSGGLAARPELASLPGDQVLDELLRQKRYSLLFEGGHRWLDLRRYGRLDDPALLDLPSHRMNTRFPIPEAECLARSSPPPQCGA